MAAPGAPHARLQHGVGVGRRLTRCWKLHGTPDVALSALPDNAAAFVAKLPTVAQLGDENHGTPTLAAVRGVLPLAAANAKAKTDGKTAVILITDGDPQKCTDRNTPAADQNTIDNVKAAVASYKDRVPTYVIGVGTKSDNLNGIASSGGTGTALAVDVGDPTITQAQLIAKIDQIRLSTLSCDLPIPPPPAGQTFDLGKVNVAYTPSAGAKQSLDYDVACKANGWHFDDATAPTKITLCPAACDAMKNDANSSVVVEFGCARRDVGVK